MGDEEELPKPEKYQLTPAGEGAEAKPTSIDFTGSAKADYTNGDVYEGEYKEGKRDGQGKYMYYKKFHHDTYEGKFEANKKTGLGMVKYKDGAEGFYNGYFVDGKRHGEGTFKYKTGDIYAGQWVAGKRHGHGTYVFNGTKYEMKGTWKDGQITTGTWTLTDGTRYVGGFRNQKPCGDGVWETAKGTVVEGAYVQQVVPLDEDKKITPGKPPATETRLFWKTATMVGTKE